MERKILCMYVWNNKIELFKRKTLIKDKREEGLDMIGINAKIDSIAVKYYIFILNNYQMIEYQYGLKWLKFKMRKFLEYINMIPDEDDNLIPEYYENIRD